jgi:aerobic carbon-monoxide dehydrogenase medium subunit
VVGLGGDPGAGGGEGRRTVKPAEFAYHRPRSVREAVGLLGELGNQAMVLGGGQSLMPLLNMRVVRPSHLVDVTGIDSLRVARLRADGVRYGATTTHRMVEDGLVPDAGGGLLACAAAGIGPRAIRCRGTVGGSLAYCDPAAEWPTVLAALEATVEVHGPDGTRSIPARRLPRGRFRSVLAPGEIVVAIDVRRLPPERYWGIHKITRGPGSAARSLAVALFGEDGDGLLRDVALWLGGAQDTPCRLTATERLLTHARRSALDVASVLPGIVEDLGAADDVAARHALRLHAAAVCRALLGGRKASFDG